MGEPGTVMVTPVEAADAFASVPVSRVIIKEMTSIRMVFIVSSHLSA